MIADLTTNGNDRQQKVFGGIQGFKPGNLKYSRQAIASSKKGVKSRPDSLCTCLGYEHF